MRRKQAKECRISENEGWQACLVRRSSGVGAACVSCVYARPDDASDAGGTWRDQLLAYNASPGNNPLGLLPAFELYENDIYRALVKQFGIENTYILSAGWGLIAGAFLTPAYDITFSAQADNFVRRRKRDAFSDLSDPCQHDRAGRVFRQQGVCAALCRPHARCKRREDGVLQFHDATFGTRM